MFLNFYGLNREPFHITPDPEFLFLSASHKEALGSILYGIEEKKGFITVTGAVGTGKTTILRACIDRLDRDRTKLIYIFNPVLAFEDLLKTIFGELNRDIVSHDETSLVNDLFVVLIEEYEKGNNVVLMIDEAQNMPLGTMERMRMLSNLETPKDKLLQIVMVGQPELGEILNRDELRQLSQRIALKSTIRNLTTRESRDYIAHRLSKAGAEKKALFTEGAIRVILKEAKGVPRIINILCDNALVSAYGYQKTPVSAAVAREIIRDFRHPVKKTARFFQLAGATGAAVLVGGVIYLVSVGNVVKSPGEIKKPVPVSLNSVTAQEKMVVSPPVIKRGSGLSVRNEPMSKQQQQVNLPPKSSVRAKRVAKKGESLSLLALEIYGRADKDVLEAVKRRNPSVTNLDTIEADTEIVFPEVDRKTVKRR